MLLWHFIITDHMNTIVTNAVPSQIREIWNLRLCQQGRVRSIKKEKKFFAA